MPKILSSDKLKSKILLTSFVPDPKDNFDKIIEKVFIKYRKKQKVDMKKFPIPNKQSPFKFTKQKS